VSGRTALVLGASGLVGGQLWPLLAASGEWDRIILLSRRPVADLPESVENPVVDFEALSDTMPAFEVDDLFICIGTTIATAGSREAFRRVDHDYPMAVAEALVEHGLEQIHLVTALGSNARSTFFYNRVKGEVERDMCSLGVAVTHCYRPSLLLGERSESRPAEALGQRLLGPVRHLRVGPLARWAPIEASAVARAMVEVARQCTGGRSPFPTVIPSDRIRALAG